MIAKSKKAVKSVTVRVQGRLFRCECGCNVFHHPKGKPSVYVCNACALKYTGE